MKRSPVDRRVARTRARLHAALVQLLATEDYETITVEDLCTRANVGRSTFYAHYTGKDDLMRKGFENLRKDLVGRASDGAPRTVSDRRLAFSRPMFEHAREHIHLHRALMGNRGGRIAREAVQKILLDIVRSELRPETKARAGIPRELVARYLVGALMAVTEWWLDHASAIPASEVDAMFCRLAVEGAEGLLA